MVTQRYNIVTGILRPRTAVSVHDIAVGGKTELVGDALGYVGPQLSSMTCGDYSK
jgi:hypothetical protein